ncbi:MAG: hypothetical protein BJ554DRAFT_6968, partial [Olpidium bornovanus]
LGRSADTRAPFTLFACVVVDRDGPRVSAEAVVGAAARRRPPPGSFAGGGDGGVLFYSPRCWRRRSFDEDARFGVDAAAKAERHREWGIGLVQYRNRLLICDRARRAGRRACGILQRHRKPTGGIPINRYVNNVEQHFADRIAALQRSGHIVIRYLGCLKLTTVCSALVPCHDIGGMAQKFLCWFPRIVTGIVTAPTDEVLLAVTGKSVAEDPLYFEFFMVVDAIGRWSDILQL